jgi:hypothetical protein
MQAYTNIAGKSGVIAFEIEDDGIIVQFSDGSIYRYDTVSAGRTNITEMQRLARTGKGLDSYIKRFVGSRFSEKLHEGSASDKSSLRVPFLSWY